MSSSTLFDGQHVPPQGGVGFLDLLDDDPIRPPPNLGADDAPRGGDAYSNMMPTNGHPFRSVV